MKRTTKIFINVLTYSCDFDKDTCLWQTENKKYNWYLTNGEYSKYDEYLGPASDVTSITSEYNCFTQTIFCDIN